MPVFWIIAGAIFVLLGIAASQYDRYIDRRYVEREQAKALATPPSLYEHWRRLANDRKRNFIPESATLYLHFVDEFVRTGMPSCLESATEYAASLFDNYELCYERARKEAYALGDDRHVSDRALLYYENHARKEADVPDDDKLLALEEYISSTAGREKCIAIAAFLARKEADVPDDDKLLTLEEYITTAGREKLGLLGTINYMHKERARIEKLNTDARKEWEEGYLNGWTDSGWIDGPK
jgi:hypothetical protein